MAALERVKQAVLCLPEGAEKMRSQFQRFSHLWTRPISEALQVSTGHLSLLQNYNQRGCLSHCAVGNGVTKHLD